MNGNKLNVLLIEDSPVQTLFIGKQLEPASGSIELESREKLSDGLERLSTGGIDAVLLDLELPDSSGLETLWKVLAHPADVAIVVLTNLDDKDLAMRAVQRGAQDYLGKERITGEMLVRSIRHAVERKRLQTALQKHAEDLERNNQDLRQFSSVAADRLRSPIRQTAETCKSLLEEYKDRLDEAARERLLQSLAGIDYMRRLLRDFRTYTRIGTESTDSPELESCETVLSEVREDLSREATESGLELESDALPDVAVAKRELFCLFRHLIDNAIKFRGEAPPRVHVSATMNVGMWLFSVRDNGQGIDPEYPGQIFEAFQTLGQSAGTGIGLAICRRIVEQNGGRIWVESAPGTGSVFYFTLPAKRDRDDGDERWTS